MSEMIERVARALYESPGSDMLAKMDGFSKPAWQNVELAIRDDYCAKARAAISAMREPTAEMLNAGWKLDGWPSQYRAAIDAALRSPTADSA